MNPLDVQKHLKSFATRMSERAELTNEEYDFLTKVFSRFAAGEDANEVLGLKFGKGNSLTDAKRRQALSFIIQWIECAVQPVDGEFPGLGYTVSEACVLAVPLLQKRLGVEGTEKYDSEYIRQCYYKPEYEHMRSQTRGAFDQDSPFQP
jgi:hypothetical protein